MTDTLALIRLALLAGVMAIPSSLRADSLWSIWRHPPDPVAVSSTSSDEYARQKFGPTTPKPESYLFFQGKYYGGDIHDADLEHAQFSQIVQTLGQDMVRQNYFPSKDPKNADLLIVVHWGVTKVFQHDEGYIEGPAPKGATISDRLMSQAEHDEEQTNYEDNAVLLGYGQQMSRQQSYAVKSISNDEESLFQGLSQERYFVILMAYDYRTMKKGTRPRLLWSTRFSLRASGNTFTAALPMMSRVAADYFGHADGIKSVTSDKVSSGKVEIGKPAVVGDGK